MKRPTRTQRLLAANARPMPEWYRRIQQPPPRPLRLKDLAAGLRMHGPIAYATPPGAALRDVIANAEEVARVQQATAYTAQFDAEASCRMMEAMQTPSRWERFVAWLRRHPRDPNGASRWGRRRPVRRNGPLALLEDLRDGHPIRWGGESAIVDGTFGDKRGIRLRSGQTLKIPSSTWVYDEWGYEL